MCFLKFKKFMIALLCITVCCVTCILVSIFIGNTRNDDEYSLCGVTEELLRQKGISDLNINQISYSDISYNEESIGNVDELIKQYINDDLQSAVTYSDVKKRKTVKKGDFISLKIYDNGVENEDKIVVGKGNYGKKFDQWIVGKKQDNRYFWKNNNEIEIARIQKINIPKLNKDFVKKNYGLDTVDQYRSYVADRVKEQREGEITANRNKQIMDSVLRSSDIEINEDQMAKYAKVTYDGYVEQAQGLGLDMETYAESFYDMTLDQFKMHCYKESENAVKTIICVGYLVNKFGLNVDSLKDNEESKDTEIIYEELKGKVIQCLITKEK